MISKLYNSLSWYSLEQAARRLSATCNCDVTRDEVLQLIIEGHIEVCWHMHAQCVIPAEIQNGKRIADEIGSLTQRLRKGGIRMEGEVIENDFLYIPFELNPVVKQHLISLSRSEKSDLISFVPAIVRDVGGNHWYVLDIGKVPLNDQDPTGPCHVMSIPLEPDYSALALRREDLEAYEESLADENERRTSDLAKEVKSLSKLAYGMAVKKYAFDPEAQRSDVAITISKQLASLPENINIDDATILKHLRNGSDMVKNKYK